MRDCQVLVVVFLVVFLVVILIVFCLALDILCECVSLVLVKYT